MATQTTLGSTVRNNSGKILMAGNVPSSAKWSGVTLINNVKHVGQFVNIGPRRSNEPIFKGSSVNITAITESGSTGFCNIEDASHGLSLGDIISVTGTNVAGYNVTHVVTEVTDTDNVKTNVLFSANTATHGSYKLLARNFNKMLKNEYVGAIICDQIAGTASSVLRVLGRDNVAPPIATWKGYRQYNITSWNRNTGAATKGGSEGTLIKFHDIGANNDTLASEPLPTRAVPGELVYRDGSATPEQDDYSARTA